jgi:hypothetical protein
MIFGMGFNRRKMEADRKAKADEVFGTQDGGESWLKMPMPQGVQHICALACG